MTDAATPPQLTDAQTGALVEARVLSVVPAGTPSTQKLVPYVNRLGHRRQAEPIQIVDVGGRPVSFDGQITPADDFLTNLKSIVETAIGPVFLRAVPGVYKFNGLTAPGTGAIVTLNPVSDVAIDWAGTRWQFFWDVRNPDPTMRSEIDHIGGPSVQHLNIDREMVPHPFTQGLVESSTANSLTIRYDPGFAPVFFDAVYAQSRTPDRLTIKDRQFDEDSNQSVISPIRPLGVRLLAGATGNGRVTYTTIDASGVPIAHGLATGSAVTILGERGFFNSEGQSAVNGEGLFTVQAVTSTTLRLRSGTTSSPTLGPEVALLTTPVPGVANVDGTWDGPVLSDGRFIYYSRSVVSPVTAVTAGTPIVLTLALDSAPQDYPRQIDGGYVTLAGTGLVDGVGASIDGIQYVIRSVKNSDDTDVSGQWELYKDDGDTALAVPSVGSWSGGGTITNVAFPGTMSAVGTPIAIACRKHSMGGLAFLGTSYAKVTGRSRSSIGVLISGIANEEFHLDLLSQGRPGALLSAGAGTVILNDLRSLLRIKTLETVGGGDDMLNVVYRWWRPSQWPLANGGADYIVGDFGPVNSRTGKPAAPKAGDTARVFNSTGDPIAVVPVVSYDAVTQRVVFATGTLPAGFNPAAGWSIRPYSAVARWSVENLKSRSVGARTVVVTGAYPVIDNLVSIGNRKYAARCNNPASGAHSTSGVFDGGLHIGNAYIADGMIQNSVLTSAIQMRRFNPITGVVATPRSDYAQSSIGNLRMERLGYGMGQIHWNMRIDSLSFEKVGYLRTGGTMGVAAKDFTVEGCTLSIGMAAGDRALSNATANSGVITVGS